MTARTLPADPTFAHESERLVWAKLRDALPGDGLVLANVRIIDEEKDHEADLVVLLPGLGVVVLEVKGGNVWYDGEWHQSGGGQRVIHPVDQATKSKQESRMNEFPHFLTEIDGQTIHFLHVRSRHEDATPIVLAHTYPASFIDFLDGDRAADRPRGVRRAGRGRLPRRRAEHAGDGLQHAGRGRRLDHGPRGPAVGLADARARLRVVRRPRVRRRRHGLP